MTLSAGTRLGPYEILAPLGAGGMGEVYRAKDTQLGRDVAIKLVGEALAKDPEHMARFEREARLLASLNHPNIAAIYGIEEREGVRFLVLELIEGQSLDDRLSTGPLPMREALDLSRQIAHALHAAHERGVVHRDLKPANVRVTPEGKAKVLDFGLAKSIERALPARDSRSIVFRCPCGGKPQSMRVTLDGRDPEPLAEVIGGSHMSFSPDAGHIMDVLSHKALWVSPLEGGKPEMVFAFDDPDSRIDYPVWSPDGKWILFDRFRPRGGDIWMMEGFE